MKEKINSYIEKWVGRCYGYGLPEEGPINIYDRVPSYKRIATAILTNDHTLSSLGYSGKKSIYYGIIKKIEKENEKK